MRREYGLESTTFSLSTASLLAQGHSTGGIVLTGRDRITVTCSANMAAVNGGAIVIEAVSISQLAEGFGAKLFSFSVPFSTLLAFPFGFCSVFF